MKFEFSKKDRDITVYHFDDKGLFIKSTIMLIEANTGLPANSTTTKPPVLVDNQVAIYSNGKWSTVYDHRGKMCYAKDRSDGEYYLIDDLGDIPTTHTLKKPDKHDRWIDNDWKRDDLKKEKADLKQKSIVEREWRDKELLLVDHEINKILDGMSSDTTEKELRNYRVNLRNYPESEGFPFGTRPQLNLLK